MPNRQSFTRRRIGENALPPGATANSLAVSAFPCHTLAVGSRRRVFDGCRPQGGRQEETLLGKPAVAPGENALPPGATANSLAVPFPATPLRLEAVVEFLTGVGRKVVAKKKHCRASFLNRPWRASSGARHQAQPDLLTTYYLAAAVGEFAADRLARAAALRSTRRTTLTAAATTMAASARSLRIPLAAAPGGHGTAVAAAIVIASWHGLNPVLAYGRRAP